MTSNHHTPFSVNDPLTAIQLNSPLGELDSALTDTLDSSQTFTQAAFAAATTLTLSAGAVTVTQRLHIIAAESGTADDLDTLSGGVSGSTVILVADSGDTITVTAAGNIELNNGHELDLTSNKTLELFYDGTQWTDLGATNRLKHAELIARTELGAPAASISITGIPPTYAHLRLILRGRTDQAATSDTALVRPNNDTTAANYQDILAAIGHSAVLTTVENVGATAGFGPIVTAASAPAGYFGHTIFDIFDYADITFPRGVSYRTQYILAASTTNLVIATGGGQWLNTADIISSLTLVPLAGSNFVTGTSSHLYGIGSA